MGREMKVGLSLSLCGSRQRRREEISQSVSQSLDTGSQ